MEQLYECMYIVRPDVTEEALDAVRERVGTALAQAGGKIDLHEVWERRDLAYEIDGCLRGTYCIIYFNGGGEAVEGLQRELHLDEEVLRHGIFVANPRAIWRPIAPEEAAPEAESPAEGEEPAETPPPDEGESGAAQPAAAEETAPTEEEPAEQVAEAPADEGADTERADGK